MKKSPTIHPRSRADISAANCISSFPPPGGGERVEGAEWIDEVVLVDPSPIGRTPRSNPVTYIKAFDAIRELFAALPEAQRRGYTAGHFSFNVPGGRCDVC